MLLSVACACSAPLWGLFAADRDRQRLNDRWERHGNIRHELILLRLERPGAGAPAPEGAAADRRYQALCAELIQVVNEYNGIRERHPDWGVPRLTAEMKE